MSGKQQFMKNLAAVTSPGTTMSPDEWLSNRPAYQPTRTEPAWNEDECRARLITQLESQNTKIIELASRDEIPAAISDAAEGLPGGGEIFTGSNPLIAGLDWQSQPSDQPKLINAASLTIKEIESPTLVCLSTAFAAAAESGTLFLASGEDNPTHLNFLSACHVILLASDTIRQTYEQALQIGRSQWQSDGKNNPPRTINMISGPSRTADIEQTLTLGAHGPIDLIVVIYE